ncbi:hypothetical protein PHYBOEH_007730 [Phytophthora boehmeriae]|uniref:M96 mating-specific protein family n=1 Tax=Phytophthora boehmeriae TaxID=109152 RepID=A0A8T1X7Q9_9STRA|nr:hypothetical protein PHYBOEH_007730 [Phytophthora boehmeriae]
MAFLAEDDDAMHAFEAVLSFVDNFTSDATACAVDSAAALEECIEDKAETASPRPNAAVSSSDTVSHSMHTSADAVAAISTKAIVKASTSGSESARARRRAADNARKKMLRKAGVYGNPNRARNERKLEIAYLAEKVGQLETQLAQLQAHSGQLVASGRQDGVVLLSGAAKSSDARVSSVWSGVAARQKDRREKAERENVRLKLILEGQIKVAKSLETLLLKRAQQQVAECSSVHAPGGIVSQPGRTMDFRADAADFQELLERLDVAYRGVDAVLASNGLAEMETMQQDIHMREGVDGMYLELFSNKLMPFGMAATAEATWNYFKGSEKHRGNLYAKAAQNLETPYTIIEHFSKELVAGNSSTDVRIKQVVRRYVEAEREVVVWVASIAPIEITRKPFAGLSSHHRNYAVIKRAKASTSERELCLLQLVAHVALDTKEGTIYDPNYVRALTDFLLSNAAGNIKADQELIENVLMDQILQQPSNLQR